jgi:ribosomal protein L30/L7E
MRVAGRLLAGARSRVGRRNWTRPTMEYMKLSKTTDGVHVDGYPNATKVVRIDGEKARRLEDSKPKTLMVVWVNAKC